MTRTLGFASIETYHDSKGFSFWVRQANMIEFAFSRLLVSLQAIRKQDVMCFDLLGFALLEFNVSVTLHLTINTRKEVWKYVQQ